MKRSYYAPAKINLWLRVLPPDDSGYHPLDSLFCALDLCDRLDVESADELELRVEGADTGSTENNLVWRAAVEYHRLIGKPPKVVFHLRKNIPVGAGLGGGSSDAAAALRAMQDLHNHALPEDDLMTLAARLGSDVPFFLCGSPLALARGRGEQLHPLSALPPRYVLLIQPDFAINTRQAYGWLDEENACETEVVTGRVPREWPDVEEQAHNTFERVLFRRYPQLGRMRAALQQSGARIAMVSGSGSVLFGVFADAAAAHYAQQSLQLPAGWQKHLARTLVD